MPGDEGFLGGVERLGVGVLRRLGHPAKGQLGLVDSALPVERIRILPPLELLLEEECPIQRSTELWFVVNSILVLEGVIECQVLLRHAAAVECQRRDDLLPGLLVAVDGVDYLLATPLFAHRLNLLAPNLTGCPPQ